LQDIALLVDYTLLVYYFIAGECTWGSTQKEWNTFLIVHAMQRKSSLFSKKKI